MISLAAAANSPENVSSDFVDSSDLDVAGPGHYKPPRARLMGLLDGKVVIITGAGGGIGRAHARLFAAEGAQIVVNDVGGARDGSGTGESPADKVVDEVKAAGGNAVANHDTVATAEGAASLVRAAVSAFGRVDVLVNNAGILRDKSFLKMDEAMWDAVIAVHLKGTFLCSQAVAKQLVTQNTGGRIVNTTSVSGMLGNFGQANYSSAKAGIYGLTRTMSIELQKHRITVNAIAPIAKTRMTEDLPMFQGVDTLTAEHIAPAALFLGSELCGDRTGHVLAVAGARLYAFKVVETTGRFKEADNGVWTAREIAESWDAIVKV
jgi:NAD(P)-dependent dehydrogenase (short-subunit alcohol dehydrogenase family)